MVELLGQEILRHGDRFGIVPVERLEDLKKDIEKFKDTDDLNGFQRFIVENIYDFGLPAVDYEIRSVIIIASPVPSYVRIVFDWHGGKIPALGLARSDFGRRKPPAATRQYLTRLLKPGGYHIERAAQLPLKRLAASCGLATYGRNNICYVDGMGSFLTLVAYFTDVPCEKDSWQEVRKVDKCNSCTACLNNCPTGAILKDRFLINNERCLSNLNEMPGDFPEWLPKNVHHCLFDCLMCQRICPENKNRMNDVIGSVEFDETETELLLSGKALKKLPLSLKKKVRFLGMDECPWAIPRNVRALLENYGRGSA